MNLRRRFSDAELNRIKASVREAEKKISGEIVPVIVEKSGYYTIANYKASLVAGSLVFLVIVIMDRLAPARAVYDPLAILILVVLAGMVGYVIPNFSMTVRRWFVTRQHMDHAAKQRAENAFLEEEIFNTRHRTGIMIFVSFFEHEVIVMADRGISKVVDQTEWDRIVNNLTRSIKDGKVVEGLEKAIARCGEILLEKGFVRTTDDVNELRDDLRING